ncbi:acidic leucine-rich nuclear phosphoprotein 32 family member A isoform X2 [Ctenocephalides felis]|uniref:acidic leucine-rich nuclear phosphoprotein 32 family member A isoform X2 n=1 Tax=Ctenocephalides felis TaxID=7515 RepID=UPI000E6E164F|nr:acidic leucine-rich nuclear phosphoprotein 32 family member A isoform X2 [Ctenocephalides felis]
MEKRIELEKRGRTPSEIIELNLDNCRSTTIIGLTDEFTNLKSLSLINVGLTSLKGFPKLPNLKRLELSDNRISVGLNLLHTSPNLTHLNLSGNKIKDLETLLPLKELKHLKNLDLFNNEVTSIEDYKVKVFELIPSLKYLDGFDLDNEEDESEVEFFDDEEENGNEDEEETDESDEEGNARNNELGLSAVFDDNVLDMSDETDYEAGEEGNEEEDDEDGIEEEEEEEEAEEDQAATAEANDADSPARGKKRKLEDGEAN